MRKILQKNRFLQSAELWKNFIFLYESKKNYSLYGLPEK